MSSGEHRHPYKEGPGDNGQHDGPGTDANIADPLPQRFIAGDDAIAVVHIPFDVFHNRSPPRCNL